MGGGNIEIGHLSLEGDLEIEEGAKVKVKGVLDLTTVESEVEIDDKQEKASRKKVTTESTDAEKKKAVQTKKGVSSIAGNVELDGAMAKIVVDEIELKGTITIGKGATLQVKPSTRDSCRKTKCTVKFGGEKINDDKPDDTTAVKVLKKRKRKEIQWIAKLQKKKRKCRTLLREVKKD